MQNWFDILITWIWWRILNYLSVGWFLFPRACDLKSVNALLLSLFCFQAPKTDEQWIILTQQLIILNISYVACVSFSTVEWF